MTSTAARHMASEDFGDPEPVGLASSWSGEPPARRALAIEDGPHFQATPVRVDEAFPEYEAYHSVIEPPARDAITPAPVTPQSSGWGDSPVAALPLVPRTQEYGWVAGPLEVQHQPPVAPGLAPYPMAPAPQIPTDMYGTPVPAAYAFGATPSPYQTMAMAPQPMAYPSDVATMQPAFQALPDFYATAAPRSTYDIESSSSQSDVALMAVGGTFMILKKVFTLVPFVIFAAVITFFALTMGGTVLWAMAGFSWLSTLLALFGRPVGASSLQRQKGAAAMPRMYVGK